MSIELPAPVAAYFSADKGTAEAVAECFTPDAVVEDEGHTHQGKAQIRQWKEGAAAKYTYTCEPIGVNNEAEKVVVICHLAGNFPGGQADLRFSFRLSGDKISALSVTP